MAKRLLIVPNWVYNSGTCLLAWVIHASSAFLVGYIVSQTTSLVLGILAWIIFFCHFGLVIGIHVLFIYFLLPSDRRWRSLIIAREVLRSPQAVIYLYKYLPEPEGDEIVARVREELSTLQHTLNNRKYDSEKEYQVIQRLQYALDSLYSDYRVSFRERECTDLRWRLITPDWLYEIAASSCGLALILHASTAFLVGYTVTQVVGGLFAGLMAGIIFFCLVGIICLTAHSFSSVLLPRNKRRRTIIIAEEVLRSPQAVIYLCKYLPEPEGDEIVARVREELSTLQHILNNREYDSQVVGQILKNLESIAESLRSS